MKKTYTPSLVEKMTTWIGSPASLVVHTILFISAFGLGIFGIASLEFVLLVLTTIVSLEAIYLAIFIQMTVNRNTQSLREVEEDIDEIQEDVDEIHENVEELGEDIDEIQEDIDEIQEDVEEMTEEDSLEEKREEQQSVALEQLTKDVRRVLADLEAMKEKK